MLGLSLSIIHTGHYYTKMGGNGLDIYDGGIIGVFILGIKHFNI